MNRYVFPENLIILVRETGVWGGVRVLVCQFAVSYVIETRKT